MIHRINFSLLFPLILCASANPLSAATVEKTPDGIVARIGGDFLNLQVCADNIIRVAYAKDRAFFAHKSLSVIHRGPAAHWDSQISADQAILSTGKIQARVDLADGAVAFFDAGGKPILAESSGGRNLEAADVQGEKTFHIRQQWVPNPDESLYGLGQQQLGVLDIKGLDIDLWQHNGSVVIPMLVSSRGYAIYWDSTSFTRFGDLRAFEPIPAGDLIDADGNPSGLSASYFSGAHFERPIGQRIESAIDIQPTATNRSASTLTTTRSLLPRTGDASVRWEGQIAAPITGEYQFQTFSNCGIKVWIDDHLEIDHWRQGWLPWIDVAKIPMRAGHRYKLKVEWSKDQGSETIRLLWKPPAENANVAANAGDHASAGGPTTSLWSEVGDGIDYYFIYGPQIDKVIDGYRNLSGAAPMIPQWAMGLWQSRQRYKTSQESLDAIEGFRSRNIPFDNIVQDWQYWQESTWGSHQFDPARFPDPDGWIKSIHDKYHAHLMISIWGKFYPGTDNFQAMRSVGYLYESDLAENMHDWLNHPFTFFDAFNPGAQKLFWDQINRALFSKGADAWWMDATEPDMLQPMPLLELQKTHMNPTALGSGSRMLNAYALMCSEALYTGQRQAAPNQRVFILTRSGFAGQQRYGAATWSGDTSSTWTAMRKQIDAGLGFCISGMPWWTMDIGGFSVPARFNARNPKPADVEEWREMNARWFEFGTFCPLLRVHGESPNREMWEMGGESHPAYAAEFKFDRLRYRLLPYIYSSAADISQNNGTMMRPLVMDFADDKTAREIDDQYMFGPAFLVSPVTAYQVRNRTVYLPEKSDWYDFWTGAKISGGQTIAAAAPYDAIPLMVRTGSIVPIGPKIQYVAEKPADPITLYVYTGADGAFSLYEDQGTNYDCEKGQFSRIPIEWNDKTKMLTLGKRAGNFSGMLKDRTFEIVFVSKEKPVGFSFTPKPDRTVQYHGDAIEVAE
jgi:alpha-D-xyloside xylohydrolase